MFLAPSVYLSVPVGCQSRWVVPPAGQKLHHAGRRHCALQHQHRRFEKEEREKVKGQTLSRSLSSKRDQPQLSCLSKIENCSDWNGTWFQQCCCKTELESGRDFAALFVKQTNYERFTKTKTKNTTFYHQNNITKNLYEYQYRVRTPLTMSHTQTHTTDQPTDQPTNHGCITCQHTQFPVINAPTGMDAMQCAAVKFSGTEQWCTCTTKASHSFATATRLGPRFGFGLRFGP